MKVLLYLSNTVKNRSFFGKDLKKLKGGKGNGNGMEWNGRIGKVRVYVLRFTSLCLMEKKKKIRFKRKGKLNLYHSFIHSFIQRPFFSFFQSFSQLESPTKIQTIQTKQNKTKHLFSRFRFPISPFPYFIQTYKHTQLISSHLILSYLKYLVLVQLRSGQIESKKLDLLSFK